MKDAFNLPKAATNPKTVTPTVAAPLPSAAYPFTDTGNAERLVATYGASIRYCPMMEKGTWLIWDGTRWKPDELNHIMALAKQVVRRLRSEASKILDHAAVKTQEHEDAIRAFRWAIASEASNKLDALVKVARSMPNIALHLADLDTNPMLLNVQNGTLDLKNGLLKPHDRADLITKICPVAFNAEATCPVWLKSLDTIMAHRPRLVAFLQRMVGLMLTGSTKEEVFFIFWGTGRNGKGKFYGAILKMLGGYAQTMNSATLLLKNNETGPREDLADLKGIRAAFASEMEEGRRLAEGLIKSLSGGDNTRARRLYAHFSEFEPTHKIALIVNHKPEIRGTDPGIWSRILMVPFDVFLKPEDRDQTIAEKFKIEFPGILNWAVKGCLQWQEHGLQPPPEVLATTAAYQSEMDVVSGFIEEACEFGTALTVPKKTLHEAYLTWSADHLAAYTLSAAKFNKRILNVVNVKAGKSNGIDLWKGLGLKAGGEGPKGEDSSNFSMKSLSSKNPENTLPDTLDPLNPLGWQAEKA